MRFTSAREVAGGAFVWVASLALLFILIRLSTESLIGAGAAVVLAVVLLALVCLDLRRAGTMFVTLAMFMAPMNDIRLGASFVTASDLLFLLGFAILTPIVIGNRIAVPPMFWLGLSIVLVMGVLASIASPMPVVSVNQVARLMVGAFALPIFFMVWRPAANILARFAAAYMLGSAISVGMALAQGPLGGGRYVGLTYHPNYFGLASLLAVALTPFVVGKVAPDLRWIFWGAAAVSAGGVWLSGSRAALLVLIMLILIYPFVERSIRAGGVVVLGVAAVLAFSGRLLEEDGESNALGRLFGAGTAAGSDLERKQILSDAWMQFRAHPLLGNGFDGGLGSHNIYLQVAVAIGIFGLIGYLIILWIGLRPLFWEGVNHRLAYPVLAYAAIGPITNTLWDRLIWAVVALAFVVSVDARDSETELDPVDAPLTPRGAR
ncbi:O-antigen ligase family protein [Aeromicrobium sp.]|uniref:O-antigen ligase family protein n=1 Tax=Aeromicrobium sp. TaxID=1871063 RepID=UPI002FC98749